MIAFERIVVPTDFSEYSLLALDYAIEIADRFSSELHILYVIEPTLQAADMSWTTIDYETMNKEHEKSAREQLAKIVGERIPKGIKADVSIVFGKPFVEIVKYATEERGDLVVMATHGRGAISHILMGSTAEKVVRKAHCAVLTVKHPKQVFAMP